MIEYIAFALILPISAWASVLNERRARAIRNKAKESNE